MSFRKNALIVLLIVLLCTLLVMQLYPSEPLSTQPGLFAPVASETGGEAAADEPQPELRLGMEVHLPEDAYRRLSDKLRHAERAFPHVRPEIANHAREEARSRLLEAAGSGGLADIVLLDFDWVGEFAAKGHLARWPDGSVRPEDDAVQLLTGWNGYRWIVPFETDPYVVAFSGLEALPPGTVLPRTLDDWAELAAEREREGEEVAEAGGLIYADPDDPGAFVSLLWAMGGNWKRTAEGMIVPDEASAEILSLLFGRQAEDEGESPLPSLLETDKLDEEEMWRRFSDGSLPFLVVPLSELSARGWANRQLAGLTEEGSRSPLWMNGTGFAVSSTAAGEDEVFEWLETLLAGHDAGPVVRWPEGMGNAFSGDPELPAKMAVLGDSLPSLYAGETDAASFAAFLAEKWPVP